MYGWIWRHLPFGLAGRVIGSVVLALAAVALLWFLVFPAVDPHLPFNNDGGVSNGGVSNGGVSTQDSQPSQPNEDNVVASPTP